MHKHRTCNYRPPKKPSVGVRGMRSPARRVAALGGVGGSYPPLTTCVKLAFFPYWEGTRTSFYWRLLKWDR